MNKPFCSFNVKFNNDYNNNTIQKISSSTAKPTSVLSFVSWNIEGLRGALKNSSERIPLLNGDVVCLQETFVENVTDDLRYLVSEYNWQISPAISFGSRPRQGIVILAKQHIQLNVLNKSALHLAVNIGSLNIISFYFPPNTEIETILLEVTNALSQIHHDKPTIVCGDFNCRTDLGSRGEALNKMLQSYGFNLCNDPNVPTYISPTGNSCIDLIFDNLDYPEKVYNFSVYPTIERKHQRISCQIALTNHIKKNQPPPKPLPRKLNLEALTSHLIHFPPPNQIRDEDTNQIAAKMTSMITQSIPEPKKYNNHHKKWYDKKCAALKKKTLLLKHTASITGDYSDFQFSQRLYKKTIKEKKSNYDENELVRRIEDSETSP